MIVQERRPRRQKCSTEVRTEAESEAGVHNARPENGSNIGRKCMRGSERSVEMAGEWDRVIQAE